MNLSRGDKFPDFISTFRSFSVEISGEMEGGGVGRMGKQRVNPDPVRVRRLLQA